ncbi:lipid II flippase MurJ [Nonomuraea sp. NPDC050310]|uniref:murein biosynthesis integral membrane protein MurJ n=1 Tax=unclassified Nonomuraea TaxID=2593643 RepID=UPI0033D15180
MTLLNSRRSAPRRERGVVARATGVTMVLTIAGSASGFIRDLLVAGVFGASAGTDAFMVAWTIPETAAPLLIEGALSFLLIPHFSREVERGTSLRDAVWSALPKAVLALMALTAITALAAPWIAPGLAPGIREHDLAVRCMQITAITVLGFGVAGYCSAALRTQKIFGPPAAIYLAYNAAIIAAIGLGHAGWGIFSVACGVAVGGVFMALIQLPALFRHIGRPVRAAASSLSWAVFVPIAAFTLIRQAQVFVERFVASSLPPGSISHLNYAQKIAQVPMIASLIVATVTFPALARSIAARDDEAAARRVLADLRVATVIVVLSTAILVAHAPDVVRLLLEHGAFTAADTEATAWSMRLYCLGLLGQAVVGVVCRIFFCAPRPGWYPALAMVAGLVVTGVAAPLLAGPLGVGGVALANAAGITLTAGLLLGGLRKPLLVLPMGALAWSSLRFLMAGALAAGLSLSLRPFAPDLPLIVLVPVEALFTTAVFVLAALLAGSRRDLSSALRLREGGA